MGETPRQLYIERVRFGSQNGLGPVTVAEGANPPLEIVLTDKVGAISASVSTEDGHPAESAALVASRLGGDSALSPASQSLSSGYGPFRLEGLLPGDYLVAAFVASDD